MKRNGFIWYTVFLIILAGVAYFKVLGFSFWRDDWGYYWGAYNNDRSLFTYLFHPGTIAEFILMSKAVGANVFWWNIVGIVLKILASLGVYRFIKVLSASNAAAKIAGLLFATTPIGIEAVGWTSAHIVLLDAIFSCYALVYFIDYQREKTKNSLVYSAIFTGFALLCDPGRTAPLILLFLLYHMLFNKTLPSRKARRIICGLVLFLLFFLGIVVVINFRYVVDTRIVQAILRHGWDLGFYVKKSGLSLFIFFSTLGNMFIGWIINIKDDVGFSEPSAIAFLAGFIPLPSLFYFWKKKMADPIIVFFLVWIYIFCFPNWIFSVIMTPGYTNRYLVVSSVGYVGFIAYLTTRIQSKSIRLAIAVIIIACQTIIGWRALFSYNEFRSDSLFQKITAVMDTDVPKENKQFLFVVTSDDPELSKGFFMSKQMPFVIKRNIQKREEFPIFTDSIDLALSYLCGQVIINNAVLRNVPISNVIPVSDVYAWRIDKNHAVLSIHAGTRVLLNKKITDGACKGPQVP
jgi:hypothetical protein